MPQRTEKRPMTGALTAPRMTIAAASAFIFTPCCRSAAKKPGPSCSPMVQHKQNQPEFLHEIERVMIHLFVEMPDENPREAHARRREPDSAVFQTSQGHAEH